MTSGEHIWVSTSTNTGRCEVEWVLCGYEGVWVSVVSVVVSFVGSHERRVCKGEAHTHAHTHEV